MGVATRNAEHETTFGWNRCKGRAESVSSIGPSCPSTA
jgi:hypothetical protein